MIDALAEHHDVIAADVPGFGRSPSLDPGVEPTVFALADAFERFFEELGLRRPHVAGNSMGGGIVLELARRGAVALGHRDLARWASGPRASAASASSSLGLVARRARRRCAAPSCR